MAEASADAPHATGATAKPESACDRCPPDEALNILRPASKDVVAAADKLTQATHAGLNLYVNGQKVHVGFLPHVLVVGECRPDGEWTGRMTSTVKIGGIGPSDQCEFEVDQVKALLPQPELEKPWPTISGGVNWTPPAMLAPSRPDTSVEAMQAAAAAAKAAMAEAAAARTAADTAWGKVEELQAAAEARAEAVLEKPWPPVFGSVNWSPSAILAPATPTTTLQTKLTEEEIRYLSGTTLKPGAERGIREFAYRKFGDWRNVKPATIKAAAKDNKEFSEAVLIFPSDSTWSRALGRKGRKK
jgi:hypothetical protein